ncbi:MAG: hypothetical protein AB1453_07210 [Chloroflexota bacterium]|jgi:hypothetical protein
MPTLFSRASRSARAFVRAVVFLLKVFPMIPSRLVDWLTPTPQVETVRYPTRNGEVQGEVYRPPGEGAHPGILVCLGVVPFEVDHPQVPVLGRALARAGFAALLYWSPAMRDFRLDPQDIDNIALAYDWLTRQPWVDAARSGLLGTCVGGSFALMAAAHPLIRERAAFLSAYAPFSSMRTLACDIASASVASGEERTAWQVDQLTRRVFVHSLTAGLPPAEAAQLRAAYTPPGEPLDPAAGLSAAAQAVKSVLDAPDAAGAESALRRLPAEWQARLDALSPLNHLDGLRAPVIALLHDRGDQLIPVGESRRLVAALASRAGVQYTEMGFAHLDPVKGRLPFPRLLREFARFFAALQPVFRQSVGWEDVRFSASKIAR